MSLLAPLFLAGLACLAIPVLVHLTRQERGKPTAFPSLMFLERIPFQETSRRRLRHLVLLLLRLAALALVVVAFARPFVRGGPLAAVGGPGPEEVVVLLDRSYSMDLADQWNQALSMARSAIGGGGPADRLSLVAFSERPAVLHRSVTDPGRLAASLDTLKPGSLGTRIAPAVKLASSILAASELPRRRAVIISDFQRSGWRPDRDAAFPEGTAVELRPVGGEAAAPANLALAGLELRRQMIGGRERVTVAARVVATSDGGAGGAVESSGSGRSTPRPAPQSVSSAVILRVSDAEVGRRTVTVPPNGAAPVEFDAFTLTNPFTRGELVVSDAALQADNALYFVASPGGDIRVLIIDPLGTGESNLYLRGALGIAEGAGFAAQVVPSVPGAAVLAERDLVILNGGPFPGGDAGARLREFVEQGGGLLMALGERSRVPSVHLDFLPASPGEPTDRADPLRLGFVDYDHAVFEAFRGARAGDFSRAAFFRSRALDVTDGRVLARFDDGSAALVEGRRGQGRVLLWATGLDRFWNDLPLHAVYLPFVHRMARYLGGRGESPPWHRAGSTVNLAQLAETAGEPEVPGGAVAMGPGGGSVPFDAGVPLLTVDVPGIWEIRPPGEQPEHPLAVAANVDLAESDLSRLDLEEFAGAVGGEVGESGTAAGAGGDWLPGGEGVGLRDEELEQRQSLWRFLLAAAFVLMAAETILANRLSRFRQTRGLEGEGA